MLFNTNDHLSYRCTGGWLAFLSLNPPLQPEFNAILAWGYLQNFLLSLSTHLRILYQVEAPLNRSRPLLSCLSTSEEKSLTNSRRRSGRPRKVKKTYRKKSKLHSESPDVPAAVLEEEITASLIKKDIGWSFLFVYCNHFNMNLYEIRTIFVRVFGTY